MHFDQEVQPQPYAEHDTETMERSRPIARHGTRPDPLGETRPDDTVPTEPEWPGHWAVMKHL
jgi:hypothetical protein